MKFIVIGLGYFGSTLAASLTELGHEVIGIDNRGGRIEDLKNSITHVIEMDTTNEHAMKTLPLDDTDAVIVAIGEDVGSSILTLSVLKKLGAKRIIGRSISPIHQTILTQIGIEETVQPERESADFIRMRLQVPNSIRIMDLDADNVIAEIFVPQKYVGHTLETINIRNRFDLRLIAVKVARDKKTILSQMCDEYVTTFTPEASYIFKEKDVLVLAGYLDNVKRFVEK